jgi:acetoacetyl-CoA synthetase
MKKVELAVKKAIQNENICNKDSLKNPQALDFYANIDELHTD